jgi:hypothetical protein
MTSSPVVYRRKLKTKATLESCLSYPSFKCLVQGAFNLGLRGLTCTTLRWG